MANVRKIAKALILDELCSEDFGPFFQSTTTGIAMVGMAESEKARKKRNPAAHVYGFVEVTVPNYTDCQFREHFRMSPSVFEVS